MMFFRATAAIAFTLAMTSVVLVDVSRCPVPDAVSDANYQLHQAVVKIQPNGTARWTAVPTTGSKLRSRLACRAPLLFCRVSPDQRRHRHREAFFAIADHHRGQFVVIAPFDQDRPTGTGVMGVAVGEPQPVPAPGLQRAAAVRGQAVTAIAGEGCVMERSRIAVRARVIGDGHRFRLQGPIEDEQREIVGKPGERMAFRRTLRPTRPAVGAFSAGRHT
jgi:hypothetical protein